MKGTLVSFVLGIAVHCIVLCGNRLVGSFTVFALFVNLMDKDRVFSCVLRSQDCVSTDNFLGITFSVSSYK